MIDKNPWRYGPFTWNGTNCSRFVRSTILSGLPKIKRFIKLGLPLSVSPTPIGNVKSLGKKTLYNVQNSQNAINTKNIASYPMAVNLMGILKAPAIPENLPSKVQWLAGEGAGSWFHVEKHNDLFMISRYDPEGKIECSGLFYILNEYNLDLRNTFEFTHISHCNKVMIKQNGKIIPLKKINSNPL
jgi:hypothetical protein